MWEILKDIFSNLYIRKESIDEVKEDIIDCLDIADALGLGVKQVNGSVTSAFQRKGLMQRVEAEVEVEDGKHKTVKFIQLTDDGRAFDPDAAADAE